MLDSSLIPNVSFQNDSCEQILGRHYELHFIRPLVYRTMFTIPNLVLINIMACRVYRKIMFGSFKGSQISTNVITNNMMFNADPSKGSGMRNVVSFGAPTTRRTKEWQRPKYSIGAEMLPRAMCLKDSLIGKHKAWSKFYLVT